MKRILLLFGLAALASSVQARTKVQETLSPTSGTATLTTIYGGISDSGPWHQTITYKIAWTSDASGNVTVNLPKGATSSNVNETSGKYAIVGTLLSVTTDPGATAPTDNYDITLTDSLGVDVFAGLGANRDTATTETFFPLTGNGTNTICPFELNDFYALAITNAGNAKQGTLVFTVIR